jgi:peptidoglycan hydrolase CwlO-like protein
LVSSQKRTVEEAAAKGASFNEQMETLRKDNAYLRRYQDQQRDLLTKLRADNDKLTAKVAALKLRAVAALDLEEEARDKLKQSEEKQTGNSLQHNTT